MLFDPPDVVHQLRISTVDFDQLGASSVLVRAKLSGCTVQRSRPSRVGSNRNASSGHRTKGAGVRDEILGNPLWSVFR